MRGLVNLRTGDGIQEFLYYRQEGFWREGIGVNNFAKELETRDNMIITLRRRNNPPGLEPATREDKTRRQEVQS